jgi:hypothetical protein
MRFLLPRLRSLPPVVEAAVLMVLGAACVAVQNGVIRVASAELHTFEVVFFRNLFGLAAMLPLLSRVGVGMFRARQPGRLLLMSTGHVLGMICYFMFKGRFEALNPAETLAKRYSRYTFMLRHVAPLSDNDFRQFPPSDGSYMQHGCGTAKGRARRPGPSSIICLAG